MEIVKNEIPEKKAPKTPKNEVETLKAEIKLLQNKLSNQYENIEDKILFFEKKQALVNRLKTLDAFANSIILVSAELEKETEKNDFFTETYFLKILKKSGYSTETELLKIQNPIVIGEVLKFALDSINTKRNEIELLINL